jgi:hypothetical protein
VIICEIIVHLLVIVIKMHSTCIKIKKSYICFTTFDVVGVRNLYEFFYIILGRLFF